MSPLARDCALALSVIAAAWLYLRLRLRAPFRPVAPMALDAAILLWCAAVPLALTARPLLSALIVAGGAVGLGFADTVKRATLREPLVFADRAELLELFRHPRLYLPFAGTALVLSATAVLLVVTATLAWLEPPLNLPLWLRPLLLAALAAIFRASSLVPLRRMLARRFARWGRLSDPAAAAARLGMLASFVVQATLAADGRRARQYRHLPDATWRAGPTRPLVLMQAESFFDVRRLDLGLGELAVPHFADLMDGCAQHGRLAVPCWGANTVRTEFAVLTGLEPSALELDRFNPYERFAHTPIESLAWRLRGCGYHTIWVHPFDTRFYGRRRALPNLGFDRIVGPEAFDRPPAGGFVPDHAVAAVVASLLREHGPLVFVFVITMQTHSPWATPPSPPPTRLRRPTAIATPLAGYLHTVRQADAALPVLRQAVRAADGVLTIYGDHQPSLPRLSALGIDSTDTDYLIWDSRGAVPRRRDLRAAQLAEAATAIAMRPRLRLLREAG